MATVATRAHDALDRSKRVGEDPHDDHRTRLRKQAIVVAAVVITVLASVCGPTEAWLLVGVRNGSDGLAPAAPAVSSAAVVGPVPSGAP